MHLPSITVNINLCQYREVKTVATITSPCPPLSAGPLGSDEARRLAAALKTIADPARLQLLSLIQAQPGGEACVCHHLKVLRDAGLVERERRGSWAYYKVIPEPLATLRELLG